MRDFKFPTTKSEHDIYFVQFEFFQIEPITISEEVVSEPENNDLIGKVSKTFDYESRMEKLTDIITLPLKTAITEETGGEYAEESMRSLSNIARAMADDVGGDAMGDLAMDTLMSSKFVPESARAAIGVATQKAINQQIQVFYNGPNRRSYSMEFPLVAKNINDAREMRLIARRLQYHASPSLVNSGTRWTYPNLTSFKFMKYGYNQTGQGDLNPSQSQGQPVLEEITSLFKSKKCYLESVTVQHGDDRYTQFTDGSDFETGIMTLTLTLKEIDYFLQEDFDDFSNEEDGPETVDSVQPEQQLSQ